MKDSFLYATLLHHPDPDEMFILDTDASDKCIGAELSQVQDGIEKTICFASNKENIVPQGRNFCLLLFLQDNLDIFY